MCKQAENLWSSSRASASNIGILEAIDSRTAVVAITTLCIDNMAAVVLLIL